MLASLYEVKVQLTCSCMSILPMLTFDRLKLLQDDLADIANYSFYESRYRTEQFETIFVEIKAIWEFDPCTRNFKSSLTFDIFCPISQEQSILWI